MSWQLNFNANGSMLICSKMLHFVSGGGLDVGLGAEAVFGFVFSSFK